MSTALKPTDCSQAGDVSVTSTTAGGEILSRELSRTPRPYAHDGDDVQQDANLNQPAPPIVLNHADQATDDPADDQTSVTSKDPRQWQRHVSLTGSESGTEADDERPVTAGFVKALPPALLRPRKGLKTGEKNADALLTPSQLDDEERKLSATYFVKVEPGAKKTGDNKDEQAERERFLKRRFAEFVRRLSEVALMGIIIVAVLCGRGVPTAVLHWAKELLSHVIVMAVLILAYPFKLSIVDARQRNTKLWHRFRVPASFDPATVLYPTLLPVLVALSVAPENKAVVLPNIVLGLASLPQRLFPRSSRSGGINELHWLVAIIPVLVSEHIAWPSKRSTWIPYLQKSGPPLGLTSETLVSLYPLHHALLLPLHYLTRTSLLISELHLLSVVLINLLLLATSPQTAILKACLWVGGVAILVFCGPVLSWNITLARVPKWKFRRPGHASEERKSLVDAVSDLISLQKAAAAFSFSADSVESDADEDHPLKSIKRKNDSDQKMESDRSRSQLPMPKNAPAEPIPVATPAGSMNSLGQEQPNGLKQQTGTRKQERPSSLLWCLRLTPQQALRRKWLYAAYVYSAIIFTVLGPVREYISRKGLFHLEAIGWALGYLLGQIPFTRNLVESLELDGWITLPVSAGEWSSVRLSLPLDVPALSATLGTANVRLLLILYWALILLLGLLVVFSLTAYVEVDTRRKVFHGVMVAMLLPTVFIDPCYCALALALVLAVFLLLEVIRAGQVPPLGSAIGRFVAPYVDGRDLRGPVVVSHLFLLVGCAVPLWFSLAGLPRAGTPPWVGWDLAADRREVAMLAGVVCVGMGDAAASLIGRRYGRRKWIWVGGKSLEGSAAFAVAVTVGLLAVKGWLVLGGWKDAGRPIIGQMGYVRLLAEAVWVVLKAAFCACGASFMEAVLTGANDNVVVPVALWLLVKGVRL